MKHNCALKIKKNKKNVLTEVIRQEQLVNVQLINTKNERKTKIKSKTKYCPALAPIQDIAQNKETNTLKNDLSKLTKT